MLLRLLGHVSLKPATPRQPRCLCRCCDAATAFIEAKCQCDKTLLSALPPSVVTPAGLNGTLQARAVFSSCWAACELLPSLEVGMRP